MQVYYDGHTVYPPASDEPRWKFFEGIEASLAFNDLLISWIDAHIDQERFLDAANEDASAGIVFLSAHSVSNGQKLLSLDTPMVFTDISLPFSRETLATKENAFVLVKNEQAATMELARLAHWLGHSRILFVKTPNCYDWEECRERMFREAMSAFNQDAVIEGVGPDLKAIEVFKERMEGLKNAIEGIHFGEFLRKQGIHTKTEPQIQASNIWPLVREFVQEGLMASLEAALSKDFTLIVCSNDLLAESIHSFLRRRKMRVPRDISLAGFDNRTLGPYRLTSVDFGYQTGGTLAVSLLAEPDVRQRQSSYTIDLPCRIVNRGTVGQAL